MPMPGLIGTGFVISRRGVSLLAVLLFLSMIGIMGWWVAGRGVGSGEADVASTAEYVEESRQLSPDDRPKWVRVARGILQAESVQAITAPVEPINNRGEASRVELGYLLFFDPILSGDRTTSCASCHHPDYGMADGLPRGIGIGGRGYGQQRAGTGHELQRNTPSLYNSAFNSLQFWDGRAATLEEQALIPIFAEDEMNQRGVAELLQRLRAVPRYRELFAAAFGLNSRLDGAEITLPNITRALAAFERKLNITETVYDRFVRGDDSQLTDSQLRGMVTFFGQGQCAVCHMPPHFHDGVLASTGVPVSLEKGAPLDTDPGFGTVIRRRDAFGQFKTPGLRNVAQTAPYMHNGIFRTLEEIIEFYNDGGGRGRGIEVISQDSKVEKLNLSSQQKVDLINFLKALDNLEPPPVVPATVPSGLPPVGR
ncbi:MAG: cytochrome-c peroxidase [Acidobacteria bacterium]|nr:cytochrome-c peroxidase [Acidobacteriota bacterium]